ncbi:MAG: bifunctional precorrin-2 dehydrogenase/sirohydrochlorin ferrochelatase [Nitrospiraceae bacterium]|nr:bifunctional precorrin-2 dehydrogenase/sirohydrochlorin ferrochelatase [Nitrospiraceae bacterium]
MKHDILHQIYYPLFIDLKKKKVLVVGGGDVAERKVKGLLDTQACIKLVSPKITDSLEKWVSKGLIDHIAREFVPGDLDSAWLVIAATDDPIVQEAVYREASAHRIFCNVVDQPELCSFIVPSTVRRGDLCLAISTGGKSPALAQHLRRKFEKELGPSYATYVSLLGALRELIKRSYPDSETKKTLCKSLADPKAMAWLTDGEWDKIEKWAVSICGKEAADIVLGFK